MLLRDAVAVGVVLHRDLMVFVVVLETRRLVMVVAHPTNVTDGVGQRRCVRAPMAHAKRGDSKRLTAEREAQQAYRPKP